MKISELRASLQSLNELSFQLPNGELIPAHFHVTELGLVSRKSIDCGGRPHQEEWASLQLWVDNDTEHRLSPAGLVKILDTCAPVFDGKDPDILVEYQQETIANFRLAFAEARFFLQATHTDCRAKDVCSPTQKPKISLASLPLASACCSPNTNCCS